MPPEPLRLLAALLLALPAAVRAQEAAGPPAPAGGRTLSVPPGPPPAPQRADLDLFLNGEHRGAALVLLSADGDVLALPEELRRAGLHLPPATASGGERISLRALAPALTYRVDEAELALRLTAGPELLGRTTLDMRASPRPEGLAGGGAPALFLDYAVEQRWPGLTGGALEAGASAGGWLLLGGLSRLDDGAWARSATSLTRDEPDALRRWIAGDATAASGPLGGALVLGGLSVQREFSLDPYLPRAPLPRGTAVATSASTLELYVNGTLVRRERLAPGTYDLANLPVTSGAGLVQAVLRDAFGRTQELDARYYYTSGLLAGGLSDYGYHLGLARRAQGAGLGSYGSPALLARHRLGLEDWITAGFRLEATDALVSAGPAATLGLPVGEVEVALGASGSGARGGLAGSLGWSYLARGMGAGLRVALQSSRYAHASLAAAADRPVASLEAFAGASVVRGLTLEALLRTDRRRDAGDSTTVSARASVALGAGAALLLSASVGGGPGAPPATELSAFLSWSLDGRTTAEGSVGRAAGAGATGSAGVQRPLPMDEGYGYRVRGTTAERGPATLSAAGQAQLRHGFLEAEWDQSGGARAGRVRAAGALVLLDGSLFVTRPVDSSFALLQVPGVAGVRGYLEGQEAGRTDEQGNLFVPSLLPYQANRLSIRGEDVPMEYDLGRLEELAAPPFRGGAVVRFAVRRISAVSGTLQLPGAGRERPGLGEIAVAVAGERRTSPVTEEGRFWLDGLPPGRHAAEVVWRGGVCRADLEVAAGEGPMVDLGTVACRAEPVHQASAAPEGGGEG
ncbi:MAG: fimbrial biogenesis outer membrane usher protein [Deltaproteobacteria bacterium]|nr:fimbrial biogenesis outer membrane usher protein [Deltaproteobacteria bacterium]